jgi:hypothetical protein
MKTNYLAFIAGGIGPDVWDRYHNISAVDFRDACDQATAKAEELGGCVMQLEQNDYPDKLQSDLAAAQKGLEEYKTPSDAYREQCEHVEQELARCQEGKVILWDALNWYRTQLTFPSVAEEALEKFAQLGGKKG